MLTYADLRDGHPARERSQPQRHPCHHLRVGIRQHTSAEHTSAYASGASPSATRVTTCGSAYVSIRQQSIRQHTLAEHTLAYASIRQHTHTSAEHTSAYASPASPPACLTPRTSSPSTIAYVSAYVSIRQQSIRMRTCVSDTQNVFSVDVRPACGHTSAYVSRAYVCSPACLTPRTCSPSTLACVSAYVSIRQHTHTHAHLRV
jgi:hypothetical protein